MTDEEIEVVVGETWYPTTVREALDKFLAHPVSDKPLNLDDLVGAVERIWDLLDGDA